MSWLQLLYSKSVILCTILLLLNYKLTISSIDAVSKGSLHAYDIILKLIDLEPLVIIMRARGRDLGHDANNNNYKCKQLNKIEG